MSLTNTIRQRIENLLHEGKRLRADHQSVVSSTEIAECRAWIVSALNMVAVLCPESGNHYRMQAEGIDRRVKGSSIHYDVRELAHLLEYLLKDIDAGLITSIEDRAIAVTFDDFLDHAMAYYDESRKQEAGVIAGVVFEDTLRRVCRKHGIVERDEKLDSLISALSKLGVLSATKAKRARVAAHVRTKATHAQWDEFDLSDVNAAIEVTRELISRELDS